MIVWFPSNAIEKALSEYISETFKKKEKLVTRSKRNLLFPRLEKPTGQEHGVLLPLVLMQVDCITGWLFAKILKC